jgi:large subunit ribosomal protein L22e
MVRKGATQVTKASTTKEQREQKTASGIKKRKGVKPQRKTIYKYFIDCSIPVVDGIFDLDNFEKFVLEKYKVGGKPGNLTDKVSLFKKNDKLFINTKVKISKRYLKYLSKRYLKKQELGEWLRVISHPKKRGYILKYLPITQQEEDQTK